MLSLDSVACMGYQQKEEEEEDKWQSSLNIGWIFKQKIQYSKKVTPK